jgi:large subunit ribosomal protein L10
MKKSDKERVVAELAERLRTSETLLVADYRGLTMPQIDELRTRLLEHGARFSVIKNTLTRRAAEVAGADALLALLEGPTAIAFLEAGADPVATAKALSQAARETRILVIRGGVLEGRAVTAEDVEELAKLPPLEALRGQVLGAIIGPLNSLIGLVTAPLQDLYGLLDARIAQLEEQGEDGGDTAAEEETAAEPEAAADEPTTTEEPQMEEAQEDGS